MGFMRKTAKSEKKRREREREREREVIVPLLVPKQSKWYHP
jgi:hypothetical protein